MRVWCRCFISGASLSSFNIAQEHRYFYFLTNFASHFCSYNVPYFKEIYDLSGCKFVSGLVCWRWALFCKFFFVLEFCRAHFALETFYCSLTCAKDSISPLLFIQVKYAPIIATTTITDSVNGYDSQQFTLFREYLAFFFCFVIFFLQVHFSLVHFC